MEPERSTQSLPIDKVGVSDLKINSGSDMTRGVKGRGLRESGPPHLNDGESVDVVS